MDGFRDTAAPTARTALRRALTVTAALALALTAAVAPLSSDASRADIVLSKPVITGAENIPLRVGTLLTVQFTPADAAVDIQWMREDPAAGSVFKSIGANFKSVGYTVRDKDLGKRLMVRVTPLGQDPKLAGVLSDPTEAVVPGTFSPLLPKITGDPKVGKKLTVGPLEPSDGTVTVTWLRDGKSTGRIGPSYVPVVEDLRTRISARVTQTASGYETLTEVTAPTAAVTSQRHLFATKPLARGTVKVGQKLRAKPGTWTAGTTFRYQWYAAGKKIPGATKSSFRVTKAQRGKLMRVRVTGYKPKYELRSMYSAPAKIAGIRGKRNKNGWAWPTDRRAITQGYHEGVAVDLASTAGGPIFAPHSGVVVQVGGDGFGKPWWCPTAWWRGENQTVVIRHKVNGKTLYTAVNHMAAGSSKALGIRVGKKVRSGQQIATEGMSGCTSGPHTHFVMRKTQFNWNGQIKPGKYIGKAGFGAAAMAGSPFGTPGGAAAGSVDSRYGTDLPVLFPR